MKALTVHIELQAIVYQIDLETAHEYLELNIARNTGLISSDEYAETVWMITASVADNEEQWRQHQLFSQLVTTLVNEYYLTFIVLE
ncbi:hypothetical protein PCC8801_0735 [Rippkaea orientalis PCC 8801]|uniref:Uncharacterized protein n=1 Tax=Rippkaea orientalis (strain PCC 8801 / RF-1) TaxID=41431 RepID=B7JXR2_RIPO1|nr:hypothetical protein [Rippkaea orientalis]ACK64819.1 hypothetical protein PCC8801_0735 [Rippkaea orientalis PCC 8801]